MKWETKRERKFKEKIHSLSKVQQIAEKRLKTMSTLIPSIKEKEELKRVQYVERAKKEIEYAYR